MRGCHDDHRSERKVRVVGPLLGRAGAPPPRTFALLTAVAEPPAAPMIVPFDMVITSHIITNSEFSTVRKANRYSRIFYTRITGTPNGVHNVPIPRFRPHPVFSSRPFVLGMLESCGPATIAGLVVTIIIDAVNCMFR
jgi:hypothetical protein